MQLENLKTIIGVMAETKEKQLFADFPPISTEEWMNKITSDLKGADFAKKLVWRTNEGFNVNPFYRAEDSEKTSYLNCLPGEYPYTRGTKKENNTWFVRQNISITNCKEANAKALNILGLGVDSLGLCFEDKELITKDDLHVLLDNISLDAIEINFSTTHQTKLLLQLFVDYIKEKNYDPKQIKGSLNFDPFGKMLCRGKMHCENAIERAAELIELTKHIPDFRVLTVNAKHLNNAGSFITQELGYGLSLAASYLQELSEAGVSAYDVATNIKFNFGVGTNYFMEIAKFRAARYLWSTIIEQYKPTCNCDNKTECCDDDWCKCAAKMVAHTETSQWNMTVYDPNVNMLRSQTEAMSATLGSVDSLTVIPYNKMYAGTSEFSERIARNQQLLLKEESHFDKIVDAAGGSYYIETLTDNISDQAWKIFLEIEAKGGFVASAKEGIIQDEVNASGEKRRKLVSQRREILLGSNQYPNFTEEVASAITKETKTAASCGCGGDTPEIKKLDFTRGSTEFEELRLATEKSGKTPKVYLLKVGNVAFRQARAQFSANFFACAGYKVIENLGFDSVEDGVKDVLKQAPEMVVICASDDDYTSMATEAYELLKDKAIFVVAGAPACADDLKAKGITNFIHVRSNVLTELQSYNKQLGI